MLWSRYTLRPTDSRPNSAPPFFPFFLYRPPAAARFARALKFPARNIGEGKGFAGAAKAEKGRGGEQQNQRAEGKKTRSCLSVGESMGEDAG